MPIATRLVIALDIGGTNMRTALVDIDRLESHNYTSEPSPQASDFSAFVSIVAGRINELRGRVEPPGHLLGVGIAIPGPFDYERGISEMTHKFVSLSGRPLYDEIGRTLPIFFLNDALAFSLGARLSEAPQSERFVGVTLGTGLGGAFLLHGFPAGTAQGASKSGEIWDFHYPPDSRNAKDKLEHYISRRAIRRQYADRISLPDLPSDLDSPSFDDDLNKRGVLDVHEIAALAEQKDEIALTVLSEFGKHLGRGLRLATATFRPEVVAIGGQITNASRWFAEAAERESGGLKLKFVTKDEIDTASLIGAAVYVQQRLTPASILIVPNEDGLGPSSLAFPVAAEISDRVKKRAGGLPPTQIVVRNKGKKSYQEWLYKSDLKNDLVRLEPVYNIIELGKKSGRVGFDESLSNLIRYPRLAELYSTLPLPGRGDSGESCAGVIDIGVPTACRAAAQRSVPRITIFDHKWSTTFEKIAGLYADDPLFLRGQKELGEPLLRAIAAIRDDEAKTNLVFLFPTFLTPEEYHEAWHRETNAVIVEIGGVFGGGPRLISRIREPLREKLGGTDVPVTDPAVHADVESLARGISTVAAKRVHEEVRQLLQRTAAAGLDVVTPQVWEKAMQIIQAPDGQVKDVIERAVGELVGHEAAREVMDDYIESVIVRRILGISNSEPIVFVSGGGTAVWTAAMYGRIVMDALRLEAEDSLGFNLAVCPPNAVYAATGLPETLKDRRKAKEETRLNGLHVESGLKSVEVEVWKPRRQGGVPSERVRFLGDVVNSTYQEIFPGVDLIVSRAGGGTVNDAIACRTPVCFVEEPHHWQVEAIRENMEKAKLARTIRLEEFKINPVAIISRELLERRRENGLIKMAMAKIPNQREKYVVDIIVDFLFNRREFFDRKLDEIEGP